MVEPVFGPFHHQSHKPLPLQECKIRYETQCQTVYKTITEKKCESRYETEYEQVCKEQNKDSYGAPAAPAVGVSDSYGSPRGQALSAGYGTAQDGGSSYGAPQEGRDGYGAPQAAAIDGYGAPQGPVCRQVPKQVARMSCTNVPRQVPREECTNIPHEECSNVPREQPREVCNQVREDAIEYCWVGPSISGAFERLGNPRHKFDA